MDASLPVFVGFKHLSLLKVTIMNCPPKLSELISPATAGLVDLQEVCPISRPAKLSCNRPVTSALKPSSSLNLK
jgi:hypothetical protein